MCLRGSPQASACLRVPLCASMCLVLARKRGIHPAAVAAWTRSEFITRALLRNRNRSSGAANLQIE
eukprot:9820546-Alexandrium_andersonii.AAC.1